MAKEFLLRDGILSLGGVTLPYVSKNSTYTITSTDYFIDCSSGTFTVTLPTAVGAKGQIYIIKNSGSGTITLATTSDQTIDGFATKTIPQYKSSQVQSNGSNWVVGNLAPNFYFSGSTPSYPVVGDYWFDWGWGLYDF